VLDRTSSRTGHPPAHRKERDERGTTQYLVIWLLTATDRAPALALELDHRQKAPKWPRHSRSLIPQISSARFIPFSKAERSGQFIEDRHCCASIVARQIGRKSARARAWRHHMSNTVARHCLVCIRLCQCLR